MEGMEHYIDSNLTRENARVRLNNEKIVIASYLNQKNVNSVVHSHPYHEFILPLSGSDVKYSISGGLYDVHVGDLIYIPSEVYHSGCYNVTDHTSERLVIQIDDTIWQRAREQMTNLSLSWMKSFVILEKKAVSYWDLRGLFTRIAQSIQLSSCYHDIMFTAQTMELQTLISQLTEKKQPVELGSTNDLVKRAVSYLQDHYQEQDLTVTKLAQEIFTSREHLSRVFKQYTMESIHSYLNNLRMQTCRRSLANGNTVMEAISESGFSNYTSFLKSFHHLYGITPTAYKAAKNNTEGIIT